MTLFLVGVYVGIGIVASLIIACAAILGDSVGGLFCSWLLIFLWPLMFFRGFRKLWR